MKEIEAVWSHLQNEGSVTGKDCIIRNDRRQSTVWGTSKTLDCWHHGLVWLFSFFLKLSSCRMTDWSGNSSLASAACVGL